MLGAVVAGNDELLERLKGIRRSMAEAAEGVGRRPDDVLLVAAAKTVPAENVARAIDAGVDAVGENYVQELRLKRSALGDHPCRWHYIGTLQTSTAHHVADLSDLVETVAGERAARRLGGRAERAGRLLEVLIEVDFTQQRAGVRPEDLAGFVDLVAGIGGLRARGLMTIPPLTATAEDARPFFARLRELRDRIREKHPDVLDLSMGMSLDYRVAIEEGATMVRIGTALFGERTP
jgi:pyridoxal phosphate enzyme (YggS family)